MLCILLDPQFQDIIPFLKLIGDHFGDDANRNGNHFRVDLRIISTLVIISGLGSFRRLYRSLRLCLKPWSLTGQQYWITSLKYVLNSVNVFAFTNKSKLVIKGNELELWIGSSTTCNFITVQSNRSMLIVKKHCAIFYNLY